MPTNDKQPSFELNVKNSFLRVKEHVSILENELRADRVFVIKQNNQIRFLLEEIRLISSENRELRQELSFLKSKSSIGNEGVYSGIHSFIHSLNIHSTDMHKKSEQKQEIKEVDTTSEMPNIQVKDQVRAKEKISTGDTLLPLEQFSQQNLPLDSSREVISVETKQISDNNLHEKRLDFPGVLDIQHIPLKDQIEYGGAPEEESSPTRKKIEAILLRQEKLIPSGMQGNVAEFNPPIRKSSTGNLLQGHSSIVGLKSEINNLFSLLSKQEFLTFLTIYQLEEDLEGYVSYIDIAAKLELTEGCIRTYVSSLIKKGIPVLKTKHNNKVVYLSISREFRALNIKKDLMILYYKADPTQKTLS